MVTKPKTLGWSIWTIVFVVVLLLLALGVFYVAY
jgi:hypothetical protein